MRRLRWSPEENAEYRRRYAAGETMSEIAEAMGRPRGTCITKSARMNLPMRDVGQQIRRGQLRARQSGPVESLNV